MKYYKWTNDKNKTDVIEAPSKTIAKLQLYERNIFVKKIKFHKFKLTLKLQIEFFEECFGLLKAGISLINALEILNHSHFELKPILLKTRPKLELGNRLSEALLQLKFDATCTQLISIGEQTGRLDHAFSQCSTLLKKRLSIKKNIKKALFYPSFVLSISLTLFFVMLFFIVPQFERFFQDFNSKLPWLTRCIIDFSHQLPAFLLYSSTVTCCLLALLWKTKQQWLPSIKIFSLKLPILGNILKNSLLILILTELSEFLAAGIPLQKTLNTMIKQHTHPSILPILKNWQAGLTQGQKLSHLMAQSTIIPNKMQHMTEIAENSGQFDNIFEQLALHFENLNNDLIEKLVQFIEPSIMIILGSILGTLMIAMYLPIFNIGQTL